MKKQHLAFAPRIAPVFVAIDGGRAPSARRSTVVIMDIDDEEARNWDAEMARRSR